MVKKRSDFNAITTLDGAKNANYYNGQPLTDAEKVIFDSPLLKKKKADGTLDTNPDLDNVRDTMALLFNYQESKDKLKSERENLTTNLTPNGNELLIVLSEEKRKNSVAYQLVNTDENGEKRVDAMVAEYQDILFREVNPRLISEIATKDKELASIFSEGERKDKEIVKKLTEVSQKEKDELLDYQTKVNEIVVLLKADLASGQPGRLLLDKVIEGKEKAATVLVKTSNTYPDSVASVIRTGVKAPYSTNSYTHPSYLTDGLPCYMLNLFKQFDRDKLFALIDKKFAADEAKKVKGAFERVVKAKVAPVDGFEDDK